VVEDSILITKKIPDPQYHGIPKRRVLKITRPRQVRIFAPINPA